MKTLSFLFLFLSVSFAAWADAEQRPNILFIYTDDQSYRTVGCYPESYPWAQTPNIDRLAETGVRFASAYVGTWCMPSRVTMLTGLHQYGVQSMRMEGKYPGSEYDPEQCRFWPSVFRQQGYQTAQIGKWHTGTDTGYGRDWDYQIVWNRPRHTSNAGNYYKNQMIEVNGAEAVLVEGYSTDNYTNWAVEYINGDKGRKGEKPWYLWLCYDAVHGPYRPADRHKGDYNGKEVPLPADIYPPREGKPEYASIRERWIDAGDGIARAKPRRRANGEMKQGKSLQESVWQYNEGVRAIDEGVGRLIEALKQSEQYENTLVVFTSDQGFAWGQHGFQTKVAPYDANIRVPMIVSQPGTVAEGEVCTTPIGGADIAPTFFAVAGIELPWKMHGHDFGPLLKDPQADWDHPVLMAMTGQSYGADTDVIPPKGEKLYKSAQVPWYVSLRAGEFKYIRTLVEGEIEELYNLETDPEELLNLALDPEYAAVVASFRKDLVAELRRTDAGFVDGLPGLAGE